MSLCPHSNQELGLSSGAHVSSDRLSSCTTSTFHMFSPTQREVYCEDSWLHLTEQETYGKTTSGSGHCMPGRLCLRIRECPLLPLKNCLSLLSMSMGMDSEGARTGKEEHGSRSD